MKTLSGDQHYRREISNVAALAIIITLVSVVALVGMIWIMFLCTKPPLEPYRGEWPPFRTETNTAGEAVANANEGEQNNAQNPVQEPAQNAA